MSNILWLDVLWHLCKLFVPPRTSHFPASTCEPARFCRSRFSALELRRQAPCVKLCFRAASGRLGASRRCRVVAYGAIRPNRGSSGAHTPGALHHLRNFPDFQAGRLLRRLHGSALQAQRRTGKIVCLLKGCAKAWADLAAD